MVRRSSLPDRCFLDLSNPDLGQGGLSMNSHRNIGAYEQSIEERTVDVGTYAR